MSVTSLENKTIRPGRLIGYSYYYSNRRPLPPAKPMRRPSSLGLTRLLLRLRWSLLGVLILGILIFVPPLLRSGDKPANFAVPPKSTGSSASVAGSTPKSTPAATAATGHCAGNKLSQSIVVSINQRHLWVCQDSRTVYDTPVVTGINYLAADKTPTGSYHIYDKQTNVTLAGSDTTGSWSDPVRYWMPFLHNQYGSYGFHDATWRDNSAFGNISPNSADASHGCIELPLSASEWLYNWAQVGTTVTIES
jgi:hypothetical protein